MAATDTALPPKPLSQSLPRRTSNVQYQLPPLKELQNPMPMIVRHNPHSFKVRHIKGLLDLPICMVDDEAGGSQKSWNQGKSGIVQHQQLGFTPNNFNEHLIDIRRQPTYQNQHQLPTTAINLVGPQSRLQTLDTINGLQHFTGLRNYSFKEKAVPFIGIVPDTEAWRQELRNMTTNAFQPLLLKEMEEKMHKTDQPTMQSHPNEWMNGDHQNKGNSRQSAARNLYSSSGRLIVSSSPGKHAFRSSASPQHNMCTGTGSPLLTPKVVSARPSLATPINRIPLRSSSMSRAGPNHYEHIYRDGQMESQVFTMICGILQTEDTHAAQAWLVSATDREKALVLDIIRSAISSRDEYYNINPDGSVKEMPKEQVNDAACDTKESTEVNQLSVHDDVEKRFVPGGKLEPIGDDTMNKNAHKYNDTTRPVTSPAFKTGAARPMSKAGSISGNGGKQNLTTWSQNESITAH